ncbi:hypothetical protein [Anaerosporobacter sp.]|uniref:hypothetical protein n=1 Tax=Anaerosporobacter sp. TaxID=1872529 RepID=UPI00286FAECD|nr:hypothetical protein [Anaerosporobacter sp.]
MAVTIPSPNFHDLKAGSLYMPDDALYEIYGEERDRLVDYICICISVVRWIDLYFS